MPRPRTERVSTLSTLGSSWLTENARSTSAPLCVMLHYTPPPAVHLIVDPRPLTSPSTRPQTHSGYLNGTPPIIHLHIVYGSWLLLSSDTFSAVPQGCLPAVWEFSTPISEEETGWGCGGGREDCPPSSHGQQENRGCHNSIHQVLVLSTADFLDFPIGQAWPRVLPSHQQSHHQPLCRQLLLSFGLG